MTFEYLKPFRTMSGDIVTMKALTTINGRQFIVTDESSIKYPAEELTPITPEEYQAHLDWMAELSMLEE